MTYIWKVREQLIFERILKMRRQPMSGAGLLHKEDGVSDELLAQLKSTKGKTLTITRDDLSSLLLHAKQTDKTPMFLLDFIDGHLLVSTPLEYYANVALALANQGAIHINATTKDQLPIDSNTITSLDQIL